MRRPIFGAALLIALYCLGAARAEAQWTWEWSQISYDGTTVYGYSFTEIDYECSDNYDAYVEGYLQDQNGSTKDSGYDVNPVLAEVDTSTAAAPGSSYSVVSYHDVITRYYRDVIDRSPDGCWPCDGCNTDCYYFQEDYYWWDPYGFSSSGHTGTYGSWVSFFGEGPSVEVEDDEYDPLGVTSASLLPIVSSISPDHALIGQPVNVEIDGSFFGNNPSLVVDQGITANITSSSGNQIKARFNIAANDAGGNHGVFVENSQGASNGVSFYVQIPSSLSVVFLGPANQLPNGCGQTLPLGTELRIRYQINDQAGNSITTSMSGVHEDKFNLTILGQTNHSFDSFDTPVIAGATDSDGTFVDVPIGVCSNSSPPEIQNSFGTFTQVLYVLVGTNKYQVRRNDFTVRFRSDCAEETNGSDIDVNNCPAPP